MEEKKPKVTIADLAQKQENDPDANQLEGQHDLIVDSKKETKPDYVFFNVMPKAKKDSGMTQPTITVEHMDDKLSTLNETSKTKTYIVYGVGILILGAIIYFVATKVGGNQYKTEDLIVKNGTPKQNVNGKNSTTTPATLNEFTTPADWRDKYFTGCKDSKTCGDNADPDQDGLTNLQEYKLKTDPNNPDSDHDGLSDGDEVNVFGSDPSNPHTANDKQYNDGDYFIGGYDINSGKTMSPQQISSISAKMKNFGLHQPTLKTLGNVVNSIYNFTSESSSSTPIIIVPSTTPTSISTTTASSTIDQTLGAKQDRDTQRSSTIKNIESGLVKYKSDNQTYPKTNDFMTMFTMIKPYLKVATNPQDPVNKDPYLYFYKSNTDGSDFTLTFFSEVAGQPISKHSAEAIKDTSSQQAAIFDEQRINDLENIRSALLLYSQNNVAGNQTYVFPDTDKYKQTLVPTYLEQIPKDPKTNQDYVYQVSGTFTTFTLKAILDNPTAGTTGYLCNQEECMNY